ncbi:MAG: glycosyl hydrolase family 8, partial [Pseudomonadota bacterium]
KILRSMGSSWLGRKIIRPLVFTAGLLSAGCSSGPGNSNILQDGGINHDQISAGDFKVTKDTKNVYDKGNTDQLTKMDGMIADQMAVDQSIKPDKLVPDQMAVDQFIKPDGLVDIIIDSFNSGTCYNSLFKNNWNGFTGFAGKISCGNGILKASNGTGSYPGFNVTANIGVVIPTQNYNYISVDIRGYISPTSKDVKIEAYEKTSSSPDASTVVSVDPVQFKTFYLPINVEGNSLASLDKLQFLAHASGLTAAWVEIDNIKLVNTKSTTPDSGVPMKDIGIDSGIPITDSMITDKSTPDQTIGDGGIVGTGSYYSGIYPSAASLAGAIYSQSFAEAKCDQGWVEFKKLIQNGAVVDPDGGKVTSEGQSYCMFLAVQNNDQTTFDSCWNWTYTYMRSKSIIYNHPNLIAWTCLPPTCSTGRDENPAPDGDIMAAFALDQASKRWGNKTTAPYNYSVQATNMKGDILTYELTVDNYVVFSPVNTTWFNPSYNMPAFFRWFAKNSTTQTEKTRWLQAAANSYTLANNTLTTTNGNTLNGLIPEICNKNGSEITSGNPPFSYVFGFNAMRWPFFAGLDQYWFGDDPKAKNYINKVIGYFFSPKYSTHVDGYKLDGTPNGTWHNESWAGSLTGAAMGGTSNTDKVNFYNDLMSTSYPTGTYRYYKIAWMNFGCLTSSGLNKIY